MVTARRVPINMTDKHALYRDCFFYIETDYVSEELKVVMEEGEQSYLDSDTLPTGIWPYHPGGHSVLEAQGVKFLGPVPNDPLFQFVELPQGWRRLPFNKNGWSDLVDEKGRARAGVVFFPVGGHYRMAYYSLSCRYALSYCVLDGVEVAVALDGNTVIYVPPIPTIPPDESERERVERYAASAAAVKEWFKLHLPNWCDPGAYWD